MGAGHPVGHRADRGRPHLPDSQAAEQPVRKGAQDLRSIPGAISTPATRKRDLHACRAWLTTSCRTPQEPPRRRDARRGGPIPRTAAPCTPLIDPLPGCDRSPTLPGTSAVRNPAASACSGWKESETIGRPNPLLPPTGTTISARRAALVCSARITNTDSAAGPATGRR
jgi:hypothetical protein